MEETSPKPFVFVLMPFSDEFHDIYEFGIKQACKDAGAYCERVDEQIFSESMLERIYNQISKADIIVADMTEKNPNVFYETGYAHALNKQVVLLTQFTNDIPFDMKHYSHIVYEGKIHILNQKLKPRLEWCINNKKSSIQNTDLNLQIYINNILLNEGKCTEIEISKIHSGIDVEFLLHNPTYKTINLEDYRITLLTVYKDVARKNRNEKIIKSTTRLPGGYIEYSLNFDGILFPKGWSENISVTLNDGPFTEHTLRFYTEFGPKNFLFTLIPR